MRLLGPRPRRRPGLRQSSPAATSAAGSIRSAVVHAWVLARSERERALDFLTQALGADVADIQGGTTPEAVHLPAMAGSLDLFQRCFSGRETRHDQLLLNPYCPESLAVMAFFIRHREHPPDVAHPR